jgi:hypothetical protein
MVLDLPMYHHIALPFENSSVDFLSMRFARDAMGYFVKPNRKGVSITDRGALPRKHQKRRLTRQRRNWSIIIRETHRAIILINDGGGSEGQPVMGRIGNWVAPGLRAEGGSKRPGESTRPPRSSVWGPRRPWSGRSDEHGVGITTWPTVAGRRNPGAGGCPRCPAPGCSARGLRRAPRGSPSGRRRY